mmetsp:Transcript_44166/g.136882  ORF Transcript_44166/g.136882 Transcript_44166/m.136882 type:complete len:534 (-) Transcript_44166:737-2338(-)
MNGTIPGWRTSAQGWLQPYAPHAQGARARPARSLLAQEHVRWDHGVGVQGDGVDALLHEPLGQVRVVGGALAADAHVLALGLGRLDQGLQTLHHGRVALVEVLRHESGVAVQAQGQLREIVAANGEAIKVLQELVRQEDVARQLCHHVHLEAVLAALQAVLLQHLVHVLGHVQGADEGDHDLHVRHAHLPAHLLDGLELHGEALLEEGVRVPAAAAEADHGVLLVGLVLVAPDEALVLVGLEVREAHNDALGVDGGRKGGDTLDDLLDVEVLRRRVPLHLRVDNCLGVGVQSVIVEESLRVHADRVVDDKLQPRQADAVIWQLPKGEGTFRVADIHHDLHAHGGDLTQVLLRALEFQQALVDATSVALGAGDSDLLAHFERVRGVACAHHGGDAKLTGDNCRMARAPSTVRDDGPSLLHDGLPVGIGHVSDQNLPLLETRHLIDALQDVDLARADALANGAALRKHIGPLFQHLVVLDHPHLLLRGDGLGSGLHYVELAVVAVAGPLDVHGPAVVLLDLHGHDRQVRDLLIGG